MTFKITGKTTAFDIREAIEAKLLDVYIPPKRGQKQLFARHIMTDSPDGVRIVTPVISKAYSGWQYDDGQPVAADTELRIAYTKEFFSKRRFYQMLGLVVHPPITQVGERCHRANERQNELGTICEIRDSPAQGISARVLWDGNPEEYAKSGSNYDAPKRTWLQVKNIKLVN
jgi:hypothetical protein